MGFSFDSYGNLKQSKMFLANPQKTYVGIIAGAENVKLTKCLSNMYELEFKVYKMINGELTENYDKIQKPRLIEVRGIGWFQIINAPEKQDETSLETYKEVKCYILENVLVYKKIYNISGTFALYDSTDTSHSLLHIICAECGWSVGHVANSLLGKYRTFEIDSMQIYNLLTTEISKSFDCAFIFNSYDKTINAYTIDEIGEKTNIVISKKNILREWVRDDTDSAIITKMHVKGGDDGNGNPIDIRATNFGKDYLINLDYFMNTDWFSETLINKWNSYKTACNNAWSSYNSSLSLLKTKQSELTVLNASLVNLESLKSAQEKVIGNSIQLHGRTPISTETDYTIYQNAVSLVSTYISQIETKKLEILAKQNEISSIEATLNSISATIDENNYFTSDEITEINLFITENEDYQDETYIATDSMTESEVIDMKLELMENASKELARISQPIYTITIKASNLFTIQDNKDELISYKTWRDSFECGNIITIKFSESYWIEARLMKMTIDFDNQEDLELTFSNRNRLEDSLTELGEVLADAGRTASSYSLNYFGYKKASQQTSSVRDFMNGSLNATNNRVFSDSNIQTELSQYGIINRKWLPDQNKYDDRQTLLTQNILLFTDDNWKSSKAGIGYFTSSTGETYYGVLADIICGQLLMGEKLYITNSSGSYTINDLGLTATATLGSNTYTIGINPSTPAEIFSIKVNGSNKLYIDTVNNRLVAELYLNALGGTISGNFDVIGTLSGGKINGAEINGGKINGAEITSTGTVDGSNYTTRIVQGYIQTSYIQSDFISSGITYINSTGIHVGNTLTISDNSIYCGGTIRGTTGWFSDCTIAGTQISTAFSGITSEFNLVWNQISSLWSAVHALQ